MLISTKPTENPAITAEVDRELKLIDPLLGILWCPIAAYNELLGEWQGRYGLTCRWPETDKRWEMYRSGEIGEPFDILGWFCEDLHDASSVPRDPDAMLRLIIALLGRCDNTRQSWRVRMLSVMEHNLKQRERNKAQAAEEAWTAVEDEACRSKQYNGEGGMWTVAADLTSTKENSDGVG